ncbi:putative repeat protein (TIGR01451 family) [Acidovorax sp. 106]|nr:putative repeat protein (TIGR01451 family) [Acidovorax sp. 106]
MRLGGVRVGLNQLSVSACACLNWLWMTVLVLTALCGAWGRSANAQDSVCAEVKIVIEQKLSLERQAFDAHMVIRNGLETSALSNVKIDLLFKDQDQNDVVATTDANASGASFFVRTDNLTGLTAIDGSASLAAKATADIRWLIIPSQGAGGTTSEGRLYYIGARVTYTLDGQTSTVEVTPDYVVVRPQPLLRLDYFLPTDVFGDDPFTPETEASEPFTLGVRVANVGAGTAAKLQIESAQPKIVENRQGLLIDFTILGGYVGNAIAGKSLLLDFGDIAPQSAKMGRWLMQTTLAGRFTQFNASFVHADSLGGAVTSLIKEIVTHKLVRDVRVDLPGQDDIDDFLAEQGDGYRVYDSQGGDNPVFNLSGAASLNTVSGGNLALQFPATQGHVHVKLPDPSRGSRVLAQVLRSDGKQLLAQNFWLSKSRNSDLSWSYYVHVFDSNTTGQYTLVFSDSSTATLGGTAYLDANGNGVRDAGEAPEGNLMVALKGVDAQGRNVSIQAYTDPQGKFSYSGLMPGRYQLEAGERSGWINGTWVVGSAGGVASDGLIRDIVLLAGTNASGYVISKRKPVDGSSQTSSADVAVTAQSNIYELIPGKTAIVTITATNKGPDTAQGVTVQAALPAGLSQQIVTASLGAFDGSVWNVGALSKDQSATLTVHALAQPLSDGKSRSITWTAAIGSQTKDPVGDNNQSRVNLLVQKDPQSGAEIAQELYSQTQVLVWSQCPEVSSSQDAEACAVRKADAARAWFAARSIRALVVTQSGDWRVAMRTGAYNVLWFAGGTSSLDATAQAEVRAAVRRGDSVVLDGGNAVSMRGVSDVFGATFEETALGSNLQVALAGGTAMPTLGAAYPLQLNTATLDGVYVASGKPAIASHVYGLGQSLLAGFDLLDAASSGGVWSQFAEQRLLALTPVPKTQPALAGSVFGLKVKARSLAPVGAAEKSVNLKMDLTSGVTYRDAEPPAQGASSSAQPSWALALPAGQEQIVKLELMMPLTSGAAEAKSQLLDTSDMGLLATQTTALQVLGLDTLVPRIKLALADITPVGAQQQEAVAQARDALGKVEQAQQQSDWNTAIELLGNLQASLDQLSTLPSAPSIAELRLDVARWFFLLQTRWTPDPALTPAQITSVGGSGQTSIVGQVFGQVLAAQVLDGRGRPMAGVSVRFELPSTGASASFAGGNASAVGVTDSQGVAHSPSLAANAVAGTFQALATVNGLNSSAMFSLQNNPLVASNLTIQVVDGQGQSATIGTLFGKSLSVRVVDAQNRPQAGVSVQFDAIASATGAGAAFEGAGQSAVTALVTTDASGIAVSPRVRANMSVGAYQVSAAAQGAASSVSFSLQNQLAQSLRLLAVDGNGQSARTGVVFGKPLTVRVVDAQSRPQSGVAVRFEVPSSGASAQFEGQSSNVILVNTDLNGTAVSPLLRANAVTGAYQVRVAIASDASATQVFGMTNVAAPVPTPVFTGTSATGTGQVTARVSGGGASCAFNPDATRMMPASGMGPVLGQILLPHGVFDFELVSCTPGGEVTITTTWPDLRGITGYLKYGVTRTSGGRKIWYPPNNLRISGNTVSYTIKDGGLGDDDLTVNGVIRDPGGPVIAAAIPATDPAPIPVMDWRVLMFLSLLIFAVGGVVQRRNSRGT